MSMGDMSFLGGGTGSPGSSLSSLLSGGTLGNMLGGGLNPLTMLGMGNGMMNPAATAAAAGNSATSDALGEIGAAGGKPDYLGQVLGDLGAGQKSGPNFSMALPLGILGMLSAMQKPQAPNLAPPGFNTPLQPGAPMPGSMAPQGGAMSARPPGGAPEFMNPYQPRTGAYYTYGPSGGAPSFTSPRAIPGKTYARGGAINAGRAAPFDSGAGDSYVAGGPGGGQDDRVPAALSPKEYVMDASTMSRLGDGNPDEGARRMDAFRKHVAHHAGAKKVVPRKAKSPLQYFKDAA